MIIFCPDHTLIRNRLFEKVGTQWYSEMLSTRKDLKAVARWAMTEGLLHQFSLTKEQIDQTEREAAEEEDVGEEDADKDQKPKEIANQKFELGSEITRAG